MNKTLKHLIDHLKIDTIPVDRKRLLNQLTSYIQEQKDQGTAIRLNFICTHNSRRSHLGQVWAAAMARYYDINHIITYSGGTEATAVYPKIVETLTHQGFLIEPLDTSANPVYHLSIDPEESPVVLFSKVYDHHENPKSGFVAVMTCSQADEGCPFIPGAYKRIAVTYEDPKSSDGTDLQNQVYRKRSEQIATEMKYVFKQIK
ncbi:arsenate-mycothiol transferase ArsC [Nonlabens ponticola]|uniref:Protein-tyrosine-phosphatase n=1 Tax=Nonlabens ponticola TaxID=2496866 RepID=A0A3S9MVJ6_9FLAO|nr:protein-tyrosine-phosphatase [Nonlabens ponticola]AZQ43159.1 protein-tyrosine-phosphatase [Nonlabens ponticola]